MVSTVFTLSPHGQQSRVAQAFSLPVSIRSLDGRFATITVKSETSLDALRTKIALELGIPGSRASQLSLTMARSTTASRNQQVRTETLGTDIRSVTQLSAKTGSSSRCNLIAENCKDLSPKIAFEVTKIMKHWISPALRSHRSTQRALTRLREITSAILAQHQDGANVVSGSHPRRLDLGVTERIFSRVTRGMELLKKLGFVIREGNQSIVLPREADLRPLEVVHGMMVDSAIVASDAASSALTRRRRPNVSLALSPRHPVFSRTTPSPSPRRSQHNDDASEDEAKEEEVERRRPRSSRRQPASPVTVSPSRARPGRRYRAPLAQFQRRAVSSRRQQPPELSYESLSQLQDVPVGLDKRVINMLPLQTLDEASLARLPEDVSCCGICLQEWDIGDVLMRLPCMHFYHDGCLKQWFAKSKKCPHDMNEVSLYPGDYGLVSECYE